MVAGIIVALILVVVGLAVWFPMHALFHGSRFVGWLTTRTENIFRILAVIGGAILIDLVIGTWLNNTIMLGIGFVAALAVFFALWTPAGFILTKLGITKKVYSEFIGGAFFWLAFAGFIRMCFPKVSGGLELMLGVTLLWIVNAAFNTALSQKSTLPIKLAMRIAIVMAIGATIKTVWPDTFVSWDSYLTAQRKSWDEKRNQKTMVLAAKAKMMIRVAERESILYENKNDSLKLVTNKTLKQNEIALVVKDSLTGMPIEIVVDGETFMKIKLLNNVGTFALGKTYYVPPQIFLRGDYEVFPNEYSPEYVMIKNKVKGGRTICNIGFLTNKPIVITEVPPGNLYSFAGVKKGELFINHGEGTMAELDTAVIGPEYKNETHPTMTLKSKVGKTIILAYRKS